MIIAVENHHRFHIFIFALLSIYLFILTPIMFIDKFLAIAICLGVLIHMKEINFKFERRHGIIIFFIVNAYLTMAFFGYDLFLVNSLSLNRFVRLFVYGLCFIWTSYILLSFCDVIKLLINTKDRLCSPSDEGYWRKWLLLVSTISAIFMVWQRAYNPIIMSPDSWEYLGDSYHIGRSIIYGFTNSLILQIAPTSPAVEWIGIAQIIGFSCLLSSILMYFHEKWIRFKWIVVAAIILPLIPSFGLHTIIIWADLTMGMWILWVTYATVRIIDEIIINDTASRRQRIFLYIQLCVALVLMYYAKASTSVVYMATVLVLVVLFMIRKQWKLLISIAMSVVLVLLIRFPGQNALNATRYPNLDAHKYYAGVHDMQATYYNGGRFSEKNLALLKKYIPNIEELRENFKVDTVLFDRKEIMDNMTTGEFISMYADTFIRNPYQMIRSMLFRCRAYWVIDPKGGISQANRIEFTGDRAISEIAIYRQHNFLTDIMDNYRSLITLPIPSTFIWRFGIWTFLLIISATWLILQKRYVLLFSFTPVFTYLATIFLTSGWTDYRYGLPVLFVGMFLPITLLLLTPTPNAEDKAA